jgi:hypothetical protein
MEVDEANSAITEYVQRACHDTLPWLISISLDRSKETIILT